MNPYQAPHAVTEQTDEPRKVMEPVGLVLVFAVVLVIGGISTALIVRVQNARARQVELMRARQALEANALRALEAAKQAKNQNEQ